MLSLNILKHKIIVFGLLFIVILSCNRKEKQYAKEEHQQLFLIDYVNPLMGTDSKHSLSNGNTYPVIATPWGMNFWTPMTSKMGDGWTYKYRDHKIKGFKYSAGNLTVNPVPPGG